MKTGSMQMHGGGGHTIAFTRTTDGSGDWNAESSTTHYGSPLGGTTKLVTLTRSGAGVYVLTWDKTVLGAARLAAWSACVELAGDWTVLGAVNRTNGTLTITLKTGGVATNVVSGAISVILVFGPSGY